MTATPSAPPKKKRRILRKLALAFFFVLGFIVLNLVFPNLIVSPVARGQIESNLTANLSCVAEVGGLSLDFFGTNEVTGLKIKPDNHAGGPAPIELDRAAVGVKPLSLTSDTVVVTTVEVRGLRVAAKQDKDGQIDLLKLFEPRHPSSEPAPAAEPEPKAESPADAAPPIGGLNLERVLLDDINIAFTMTLPETVVVASKAEVRWREETLSVRDFSFHLQRIRVSGRGQILDEFPWDLAAKFYHGEKLLLDLKIKGKVRSNPASDIVASLEAELGNLNLNPYFDLQGSGVFTASARIPLKETVSLAAELALKIPSLTVSGYTSKDLSLTAKASDKRGEVKLVVGELIGGRFELGAEAGYGEENFPWKGEVKVTELPITKDWFAPLERLSPIVAFAVSPEAIQGRISLQAALSSQGPDLDSHLRNVSASGSFSSKDLVVKSPIFAAIGAVLKEEWDPLQLKDFHQAFRIEAAKVNSQDIPLSKGRTQIVLAGKTTFDGQLDYSLKVKAIDGKDLSGLNLGQGLFGIKGSVTSPELIAPNSVEDVLQGTIKNVLEGDLKGTLGNFLGGSDPENPSQPGGDPKAAEDAQKAAEDAQKALEEQKKKLEDKLKLPGIKPFGR